MMFPKTHLTNPAYEVSRAPKYRARGLAFRVEGLGLG